MSTYNRKYYYPTYNCWKNMMRRCYDINDISFHKYGARGITVCDAWRDFRQFKKDMGEKPPDKTLGRKDGTKGYSPENCEWQDWSTQNLNRRPRKRIRTWIPSKARSSPA